MSGTEPDGRSGREDPEAILARIREHGHEVAERERERALRRLRARGSLSEREAEAVAELADSLTEQLLAVPERHLRDAEDADRVRAALELFEAE